jgi:acetyl-CoA carboxylase biotin carboxyl carrier protein
MTIEEIRELIQTVVSTGVAELEVQRGENRVWIKRTGGAVAQEITVTAAGATHAPVAPPPAPPAVSMPAAGPAMPASGHA